jgi:hypothetical protein
MFIPSVIKQKSDMLVLFDYPSVNDSKGHLQDSNMKNYFSQAARKLGLPITNVSYHCVVPYAMGRGSVEDLFLTKKTDMNSRAYKVGDFYFHQGEAKLFEDLLTVIAETEPKIIICCSKLALILFANASSLDAFRGSMLIYGDTPVLVTYSPLDLYTRPELHLRYYRDLMRAGDFLSGKLSWDVPKYNIYYGTYDVTLSFLNKILLTLAEKEFPLSVDLETRVGLISFCGIAVDKRTAVVIPFITWDDKSYWTYEQEVTLTLLLRKILVHKNAQIIGQNFQYDTQYVAKHWGVLPVIWRDTMIEAHVNWTKGQPLALGFLSSMYCGWYRYWKEDGKDFHKSFQTEADWNQYALYNAYDCCYTYEVAIELNKVAEKDPREEVREFQRAMQNIVLRPVLRGVRFDKKKQLLWKKEYGSIIQSYRAWFEYIVPDELIHKGGKSPWYDSSTRMMYFFYNQLGLDPVLNKKTKRPSVDDAALAVIYKQEPILRPLIGLLQSYRSLRQFYNTYLCADESTDSYMRTQYLLGGTDTFRLASRKDAFDTGMNLQNISKG